MLRIANRMVWGIHASLQAMVYERHNGQRSYSSNPVKAVTLVWKYISRIRTF